ncbi:TolC family protein [Paraburkholderia bonniea]|uniref:TolC family protein n=1 Tax=Paraburkholderia bonniea TaxID=2152891 RepID=UPI001580612B|nr:TolC family protein [Paraburkholderia bonniea]WJF90385.1 TolC family protein [Paraburkholderia bonniea]WJF93700.1 TolC family protein [Paraburkholderia bonniea]
MNAKLIPRLFSRVLSRLLFRCLSVSLLWVAGGVHAALSFEEFDPLASVHELAAPPPFALMPETSGITPCSFDSPASAITLEEAADRALCHHPQTRRAWASAQVQAARVGQARGAMLPTLAGVLNGSLNQATTSAESRWTPNSSYHGTSRAAELSLEWVLFDFGARSAEVRKTQALLNAANHSLNAATLDVLYTTARDYIAVLTTQAQASAARQAEDNAQQSLQAAEARMTSGVASVADALQARTAFNEAKLARIKAQTALAEAQGALAIDIGVDPGTPLQLTETPSLARQPKVQLQTIGALLEEARTHHPKLLAARAELNAAEASLASVRAQALPSVRLQGGVSNSYRPMASQGESGSLTTRSRSRYVGVRINIPLFEGWSSMYRSREARAQIRLQQADIAGTEQQVVLNIWKSYNAVDAGVQTLQQAEALLENALLAFAAARARYHAGVAGMTELLRAQDSLVEARQQRIAAEADWQVARLSLAASLGQLTRASLDADTISAR